MASSLPFLCTPVQPNMKSSRNVSRMNMMVQVNAHNIDEGRSSRSSSKNMVDSNLSVLREKMELVKMKERLDTLCSNSHFRSQSQNQYGWNHTSSYKYSDQLRRAREVSGYLDLMRLVFFTIGFTWFSATSGIFLVSMFLHILNQ